MKKLFHLLLASLVFSHSFAKADGNAIAKVSLGVPAAVIGICFALCSLYVCKSAKKM